MSTTLTSNQVLKYMWSSPSARLMKTWPNSYGYVCMCSSTSTV